MREFLQKARPLTCALVLLATSACEKNTDNTAKVRAPQPAPNSAEGAESANPQPPELEGFDTAAREVAVLAGGCFWGMEEILRDVPGVLDTEVGYAGGSTSEGSYEQVKTGSTDHAEAIRVVFDPSRLAYSDLLTNWFFRMHDPTTMNRQGNDRGRQYRSAIFFQGEKQKNAAQAAIDKVTKSGQWSSPIVTEVTPYSSFVPAESYHQDYLEKNPRGYTCHYMRDPTL